MMPDVLTGAGAGALVEMNQAEVLDDVAVGMPDMRVHGAHVVTPPAPVAASGSAIQARTSDLRHTRRRPSLKLRGPDSLTAQYRHVEAGMPVSSCKSTDPR